MPCTPFSHYNCKIHGRNYSISKLPSVSHKTGLSALLAIQGKVVPSLSLGKTELPGMASTVPGSLRGACSTVVSVLKLKG